MAIRMRRGLESELDISKAIPGEWLVSTDTKYVRMCFAPGIVLRMATYEAFEADLAEIQSIIAEARTIQEAVLRINAEIKTTAVVVEDYSVMTKSYAVGGTGTRENEDVDNAKYYYEQAKHISQGLNGLIPLGTIAFENLPTEDILTNGMYNISNDFTSDERFLDGGGVQYGKGSNIYYTVNGFWDVLAASDVKGIRGAKEDLFRQGNVTLTPEDLGAASAEDLDAVNESLGKRNLQTYTNVSQIDPSYTIANFQYKNMPKNATLTILIDNTTKETAYANGLIPLAASGELHVSNVGGGRGHIEFHRPATKLLVNYAFVTFASLTSNADVVWDGYASNSDLPQYKDLTLTFDTTKGYAPIDTEVPSGFAPVSVVSLYEWANFYLVYRNGNSWSVFAENPPAQATVRVWFAKV